MSCCIYPCTKRLCEATAPLVLVCSIPDTPPDLDSCQLLNTPRCAPDVPPACLVHVHSVTEGEACVSWLSPPWRPLIGYHPPAPRYSAHCSPYISSAFAVECRSSVSKNKGSLIQPCFSLQHQLLAVKSEYSLSPEVLSTIATERTG